MPTVARAADPYPKFTTTVRDEQVEVFFLMTRPEERPKDLKVHVRKKGSSVRVATLTRFTYSYATPPCGDVDPCGALNPVRLRSEPLKLAALGEYTIDVEYVGTLGETVVRKDRAALNYQVRPVFGNLKAANAVSLDQLNTVVSGDIKLYDPRDGSSKPYPGGAFTTRTGAVTTPAAADANGHFETKIAITDTETITGEDGGKTAVVHLSAALNGIKEDEDAAVPVKPVAADIAVDSATVTGRFGSMGTVGGAVTWKSPDGTWKPVPPGMSMTLNWYGATFTTGASGRFTGSQQVLRDETWEIRTSTPWLTSKEQSVTVRSLAGTTFSDFKVSLDPSKTVEVSAVFACGVVPAGTASLRVDVQYSADGKTGWTTRKSLTVPTKAQPDWYEGLSTTLPYPGPGFVRMRYAGTPAVPGSETPAVKLPQRTMTAIPEFNAAPEPVGEGKPITVTGKLNHADPTWKPFAGQTVHYYFRKSGDTTWRLKGTSKTAADGTFTKNFPAVETGSWFARYGLVDATHFVVGSRVDEVVVTP